MRFLNEIFKMISYIYVMKDIHENVQADTLCYVINAKLRVIFVLRDGSKI